MKKFIKILCSGVLASSILLSSVNVFAESEKDSKWVYDKKGTIIYNNGGSPLLRDKLHFEQYGVEVFDADGNSLGKIDIQKKDLYSNASDLSLDFPNEIKDNQTENSIKNNGVTVKVPIVPVFEEVYKEPTTQTTTNSIINQSTSNQKVIRVTIGSKIGNVNGQNIEMDVAPYIRNGVTMIPLRFVASSLGIPSENIIFNEGSKSVTIKYSKDMDIHFLPYEMEIKNGRTFIPFRLIGKYLNLSVEWDNKTKTVIMKGNLNNSNQQVNNTNITNNNNEDKKENKEELTETQIRAMEEEVVRLVNEERAKYGLNPLQIDETLMQASKFKAKDMFDNSYFSHNSPNYGSPTDMLKNLFNYKFNGYYTGAGENIATMGANAIGVMNGWLNSKGHRDNILNPNYKYIGVAFYNSKWVQLFS